MPEQRIAIDSYQSCHTDSLNFSHLLHLLSEENQNFSPRRLPQGTLCRSKTGSDKMGHPAPSGFSENALKRQCMMQGNAGSFDSGKRFASDSRSSAQDDTLLVSF